MAVKVEEENVCMLCYWTSKGHYFVQCTVVLALISCPQAMWNQNKTASQAREKNVLVHKRLCQKQLIWKKEKNYSLMWEQEKDYHEFVVTISEWWDIDAVRGQFQK